MNPKYCIVCWSEKEKGQRVYCRWCYITERRKRDTRRKRSMYTGEVKLKRRQAALNWYHNHRKEVLDKKRKQYLDKVLAIAKSKV